jgi:regulator of protease activity HflC (stomatin/prohibitin superfamily)
MPARSTDASTDFELMSNSPESAADRLPRFGYVTGKPSEYLIVYRRGRLLESACGQGARFFRWPGDEVAVVPTTFKEVRFQANQVTRDNVDIRIRGMVLYRIADPIRIYKLVNFTNRQAAELKLAHVISDLCRSTTKWLVANMGVEECLRRRKEEIAAALKSEVAKVVSGTAEGSWGVEIVTIDILDVYIQDAELFTSIQARFKAEQRREAELATLAAHQVIEQRKIERDGILAAERHQAVMKTDALELERERNRIAAKRQLESETFALDRFRVEENEKIAAFKAREEIARRMAAAEAAQRQAAVEAETSRIVHDEEARALRERLAAENTAGEVSVQRQFIETALPVVARSLGDAMANMNYTVFQGDGGPGTPLNFAVAQLFDLLGKRGGGRG